MLLGLLALALVDSINPSAIVVTLYLLSRGRAPAQVAVYVAAIFLTYLTLGVTMMSASSIYCRHVGNKFTCHRFRHWAYRECLQSNR